MARGWDGGGNNSKEYGISFLPGENVLKLTVCSQLSVNTLENTGLHTFSV